jgi:hypothetical protein
MAVRPTLIRNEDTLIGLLRGRRQALGMSQAEVDERIGWAPAYCSKAEAPHRRYGRRVFACLSNLLDEWLEGLGLALVLMTATKPLHFARRPKPPPLPRPTPAHIRTVGGRADW